MLFAHFDFFDIEDGKKYRYYDDVFYGDYLYAGTSVGYYRKVVYTGSDEPMDLETPGNTLVFTFEADESVSYTGFSISILSRHPTPSRRFILITITLNWYQNVT